MNLKKTLERRVRGWLPEEFRVKYANAPVKPRWRKPQWIALSLLALIALAFVVYAGVQTCLRYTNPQLDVTASYFEKSLNCSTASIGDVVEVQVLVGWHGYILPEFKRQVEIIDPYSEGNFQLIGGNNTYTYSGYGGGNHFTYLLEVTKTETTAIELPKPKLFLDNTEIPLSGTGATLDFS
jgi:hypothetical protein